MIGTLILIGIVVMGGVFIATLFLSMEPAALTPPPQVEITHAEALTRPLGQATFAIVVKNSGTVAITGVGVQADGSLVGQVIWYPGTTNSTLIAPGHSITAYFQVPGVLGTQHIITLTAYAPGGGSFIISQTVVVQ